MFLSNSADSAVLVHSGEITRLPFDDTAAASGKPDRRMLPAGGRAIGLIALGLWCALIVVGAAGLLLHNEVHDPFAVALSVMIAVVAGTLWFNGLRTLLMLAAYPFLRARSHHSTSHDLTPAPSLRVELLYCTANDFNAHALRQTMGQTHPRVRTVILDDSSSADSRQEIDVFAALHGVRVVRREDRSGFKAGNLNHYFRQSTEAEAFVILDSDEVLPPTFVADALSRLRGGSGRAVGIVQGRHRPHRGQSRFADEFGPLFESHVTITQTVRSRFGFSSFTGRGALITAECVRASGGFPELVMEDLAFSVEAQIAGYDIVFAPELVCKEDFPIDYHAFRKQQGKFVQGAVEFLQRFTRRILASRLTLAQKIDVLVDTAVPPVGALLALLMLVTGVIPSSLDGQALMPSWMSVLFALCAVAPFLGEVARRLRQGRIRGTARFLVRGLILYASLLVITIRSATRVLTGNGAVFAVTPKRRSSLKPSSAFRFELLVAMALVAFGIMTAFPLGAAAGFVACAVAARHCARFERGNRKFRRQQRRNRRLKIQSAR